MKNKFKAILLAASLTACTMAGGVYAEETSEAAESAQELVTEAAAEEAAAADTASADEAGLYAQYYDQLKTYVATDLAGLSALTDEQIESALENPSATVSVLSTYTNWKTVKEELGSFVEVTDQTVTEDGSVITVESNAVYDGVDEKTKVVVTTTYDMAEQSQKYSWDVQYPMSKLIQQAALNTLMGVGIVFIVLLFLSLLIGQMHWIPEILDKKNKKAAPAAAPAVAPAPAPAVEAEELVDDGELVAVIAAAIAASENTSTDGFVVRSIRKANRKNWQNA